MSDTNITGAYLAHPDDLGAEFLVQATVGNVPKYRTLSLVALQEDLDPADGNITIWDNKFAYTPFTGVEEMFVNSTNAGDTMTVRVSGLDSNYDRISVDVVLSGQTQVTAGNFTHVQDAVVLGSVTPAGDVYIAASDTLTAGVTDTNSKVKSKIIQGYNITHNGFYMTPAGDRGVTMAIRASTDSSTKFAEVETVVTPPDGVPLTLVKYTVSAGFPEFIFRTPTSNLTSSAPPVAIRGEKTLVEYRALAGAVNTHLFLGVDLLIIDATLTETA